MLQGCGLTRAEIPSALLHQLSARRVAVVRVLGSQHFRPWLPDTSWQGQRWQCGGSDPRAWRMLQVVCAPCMCTGSIDTPDQVSNRRRGL